jgi:hypothetical protein
VEFVGRSIGRDEPAHPALDRQTTGFALRTPDEQELIPTPSSRCAGAGYRCL